MKSNNDKILTFIILYVTERWNQCAKDLVLKFTSFYVLLFIVIYSYSLGNKTFYSTILYRKLKPTLKK